MSAWFVAMLCLLVAGIGFAAHRASLCTVRAASEILDFGRAQILASFLKAALWAAFVYGALLQFVSPQAAHFAALEPRALALAGGFVFGLGAAINGACSYSTLQRIADGGLWGLTSLAGIALGVLGWSVLDAHFAFTRPLLVNPLWSDLAAWGPALLALLGVLGAAELLRLWHTRPRGRPLRQIAAAPAYRVSSAAALMGICAGLLYGLQGAWSYSTTLRRAIDAGYRHLPPPSTLQWLLFAALFAGMLVSSLQRGSFTLRWRSDGSAGARLAGGFMMGVGASLVPGGNDSLILNGVPSLSGWALAAYAALFAGVVAGLWARRRLGVPLPSCRCVEGVCVVGEAAKP